MDKPQCILVRVGELSLKSEPVKKIFLKRLANNIKLGLDSKKIKYRVEMNPSRIFIYTKDVAKTEKILKKIIGVTSFSPVWIGEANINDIRKCSVKLGKMLKLNKKKSFAIRAKRAGNHEFTSQDIGREAGDAVNVATSAKVDLTNPDVEIFVECRQDKSYLYINKERGVGGLPLWSFWDH